MRRFSVEHIFVTAYRQYGNCRRTHRQTENCQNNCQTVGEFASEIEIEIEIDGEIEGAEVASVSDKLDAVRLFSAVNSLLAVFNSKPKPLII